MQFNYVHEKMLSNKELLMERIEYDFLKYEAGVSKLNSSEILKLASQIAVVVEVHTLMYEHDDLVGEDEAACMLRFENPLMMLANEWLNYKSLFGAEFEDFIGDLMTVPDSELDTSLMHEHESDTRKLLSVLTDMVGVCNKLYNFIESKTYGDNSEGDGFWSED